MHFVASPRFADVPGRREPEVALWEIRFGDPCILPSHCGIYGVGAHPMAAVPILPKYSRPFVSVTLVTGP